jgi:murein DD-endopeptidase MepM/ murein hydrolase activator NlpD
LIVLLLSIVIPPYREAGGALTELADPMTEAVIFTEDGFVMKTASISEQGHRRAYARGITHIVSAGESLASLAEFYGIAPETIQWANSVEKGKTIHPGQELLILPVDGVLHTVRSGQNLLNIAALYEVSVEEVVRQNQLKSSVVVPGQQLIVPGGTPLIERASRIAALPGVGKAEDSRPRPVPAPLRAIPPPSPGIFQFPCDCIYTQYFTPSHYGVDLSSPGGGPIFAAADGTVTRASYGWNGGYGNVIEIDHGNGLVTLYAHNQTLHVREGTKVKRGEVIATMGRSGRVFGKTGVHLHFEVQQNGVKKNPVPYLQ